MDRRAQRSDRSSIYPVERSMVKAQVKRTPRLGSHHHGGSAVTSATSVEPPGAAGVILVVMKPAHGATRRFLPGSPFNNMPAYPPVEQFDVQDQVTHDSYGLGRVLVVEDDTAGVVAFGS